VLDRISVELTNECSKACSFCYNTSSPAGATQWSPDEVVAFAVDCAANGIGALSLGGGEPLQYPGLFQILRALDGTLFRSFTTNGLLLDEMLDRVVQARPDKVHVSLHFPEREPELRRVIRQVGDLAECGITSGVNLLIRNSHLRAASSAAQRLYAAGIGVERIMFLPMRGEDTPTARDVLAVAANSRFQSMTCLLSCAASDRFASIGWDKRVAWCSYTATRQRLERPTYGALMAALDGLALATC